MLKIPSRSKTKHPSWADSKAVQFLSDACKDFKHYFEKSLSSPGKAEAGRAIEYTVITDILYHPVIRRRHFFQHSGNRACTINEYTRPYNEHA